MNIKTLKANIKSLNIPKFLIFVEEEPALSRQYSDAIATALNKSVSFHDSIDSVLYDIGTGIRGDYLYIVRDENGLKKNCNQYVKSLIDSNKFIIVKVDSRETLCGISKDYDAYIVDFKKLDKNTILAYMIQKFNEHSIVLEQDKMEAIIDRCNCNLGMVLNEIDKIFTLGQSNSNILVDYMMVNGFSDYTRFDINRFVSKILNKDGTVLDDIYKVDVSPVSIAYTLYMRARNLFLTTKNGYYHKVMKASSVVYNSIIDGTMDARYAVRYLIMEVL